MARAAERQRARAGLPVSIDEEGGDVVGQLLGDEARAAVILRQLLDGPIRVIPYMRIDGKRVVPRLEFTINLVAALPIVGVAPILVMWFGFDWPSKAAMVVVMTFFPMLVNAVAGLEASGHLERDLMRSYGSSWWQTLVKLRLPAAMPFIFNALKINSTLAMIGAIVAEFFGTPIVGMGFRISTEVGRLGLDMVWAEIAVAAITGSAFYGLLVFLERRVTFWHPSYRK